MSHLRYNNLEIEQKIFVIQGLNRPLLGLPAIETLAIVSMVEPIMILEKVAEIFPCLFQSLVKMKDN